MKLAGNPLTSPATAEALLRLDALVMTRLAEELQRSGAILGPNTDAGKPFADAEAALWVLLDQRDALLSPALFPNAKQNRTQRPEHE